MVPLQAATHPHDLWRGFRSGDGLGRSPIQTLTLSPNGTLWIVHAGSLITHFDGYRFQAIPKPEYPVLRVFENRWNQVWSLCEAGLLCYENQSWSLHPVREIREEAARSPVFPRGQNLVSAEPGVVLVVLSDRLLKIQIAPLQVSVLKRAEETGLGRFQEMVEAQDGGVWVTGEKGLARIRDRIREIGPESEWKVHVHPDGSLRNFHSVREHPKGESLALAAEDASTRARQLLVFAQGAFSEPIRAGGNLRTALFTEEGLWVVTRNALYFQKGESLEERELPSAIRCLDAVAEKGGVFWVASSDGLWRRSHPLWQRIETGSRNERPVHAIRPAFQPPNLWVLKASEDEGHQAGSVLLRYDGVEWRERQLALRMDPDLDLPPPAGRFQVWPVSETNLLIHNGTHTFSYNAESEMLSRLYGEVPTRVLDLLKEGPGPNILLQLNPGGPDSVVVTARRTGLRSAQTYLDAEVVQRIGPNLFLRHQTETGEEWIGGQSGLVRKIGSQLEIFPHQRTGLAGGVFCALDVEGKIWFGGMDSIIEYNGKTWREVRGRFESVFSMKRSRDGSIWVATGSGLYRLLQRQWLRYGVEDGLPHETVYDLWIDPDGGVWAGTMKGLSRFLPSVDNDPPKVRIQEPLKSRLTTSEYLEITWDGADKWNSTLPAQLLYAYRLDDGPWSEFREQRSLLLSGFSSGPHTVEIAAIDRAGNISKDPLGKIPFMVVAPWHQDPRVLASSILGMLVAIFFAVLAFNRHRQLVRSYAEVERIVDLRTRELQAANQELLHSQKMKALGTLAAGIAHDFNNILSIVKGSAQIIETNLEDPSKITTRVSRIKTVVEQGATIVRAMLGYSQEGEAHRVPLDLNALADETVHLLGDHFLQKIQVRLDCEPGLPPVRGLKDLIQQMLLNFIFNGAEAMGDHGEIVIRTGRLDRLPPAMALAPLRAPAYLHISVVDSGCGIPQDNLERIFEPFFTTKAFSARRGTGLGLSMVYEFAKALGYGLSVTSVVGKGSTFSILIPVAQRLDSQETPAPKTGEEASEASEASGGLVRNPASPLL